MLCRIRFPGSVGYDVECQRSDRIALHVVENAASRQHRPVRCSALLLGRVVSGSPEVGACRQARIHLGLDFRKEVRRRIVALNMRQRDMRSARRKPSAWESNGLWVLVS
jgi:hypothetical protein